MDYIESVESGRADELYNAAREDARAALHIGGDAAEIAGRLLDAAERAVDAAQDFVLYFTDKREEAYGDLENTGEDRYREPAERAQEDLDEAEGELRAWTAARDAAKCLAGIVRLFEQVDEQVADEAYANAFQAVARAVRAAEDASTQYGAQDAADRAEDERDRADEEYDAVLDAVEEVA